MRKLIGKEKYWKKKSKSRNYNWKVYAYDPEPTYGGWFHVDDIKAKTEPEALRKAKKSWGQPIKIIKGKK